MRKRFTTLIDEYHALQMAASGSVCNRSRIKGKTRGHGNFRSFSNISSADLKDGNASDDHNCTESTRLEYEANSNGYRCTFCERDGHTSDRYHINLDNPDDLLFQRVLKKLSLKDKDMGGSSKSNRKLSAKSSKIEIDGML